MDAQLDTYLRDAEPRQLAELQEWLRIPSISTLSEHKKDVRRAAEWLVEMLRQAGLENAAIIDTDTQPMVYAEWLHAGPEQPTLLISGRRPLLNRPCAGTISLPVALLMTKGRPLSMSKR